MKVIIAGDRLALMGNDIDFNSECLFNLKPGTEITQIGDGRENGSVRTDKFSWPVRYVGSVEVEFKGKEKMYAFDLNKPHNGQNVYLLYGSTGSEVFTEATYSKKKKQSYVRWYKPLFIIEC